MTGRAIDGLAWLQQAIADVLLTPLGSCVMRRDYGSLLPELLDQPVNRSTTLRLYAATALALMRAGLPFRLTRVSLADAGEAGAFTLRLEGDRLDQLAKPVPATVDVLLRPSRFPFAA